jgi:FkbM family methyltransferase
LVGVARLARIIANWLILRRGTYTLILDGCPVEFIVSERSEILRLDNAPLEAEVIRHLCLQCRGPDELLFDVGANIGVVSICAAVRIPTLHVHAFEPVPSTATAMQANVEVNRLDSRFKIHTAAISSSQGSAYLHTGHRLADGHASLVLPQRPDDHALEVLTTTLDAVASELSLEPTVVKIDVEGAELAVVAGMSHLIRRGSRLHSVLIEVHPTLLHTMGRSLDDVVQPFIQTGFCVEWSSHRGSEIHCLLTRSEQQLPCTQRRTTRR